MKMINNALFGAFFDVLAVASLDVFSTLYEWIKSFLIAIKLAHNTRRIENVLFQQTANIHVTKMLFAFVIENVTKLQ